MVKMATEARGHDSRGNEVLLWGRKTGLNSKCSFGNWESIVRKERVENYSEKTLEGELPRKLTCPRIPSTAGHMMDSQHVGRGNPSLWNQSDDQIPRGDEFRLKQLTGFLLKLNSTVNIKAQNSSLVEKGFREA